MAIRIFPNGLRLGVQETESERLVCIAVHIIGGSQSETNYQSGVGEFLSRMLTQGTVNYPSRELLLNRFKQDGIIFDSDCKAENLLLTALCQVDRVENAIDLLSEVLFKSNFTIESANDVRNEMLGDIFALSDSPSYQLTKLTNNAMFSRTGLANPRFGTTTTIERMKADDAKDYLSKLLTPKNTIITVAGNIDPDDIYEIVMKKFYSQFIEHTDYKKLKYVAHVDNVKQNVITRNKKLNQSRIMISFPSADYRHIKRNALAIALPIVLRNLQQVTSNLRYYHNEVIDQKKYAANGKLSFELIVDGEHALEYLDVITNYLKHHVYEIEDETYELEKNVYMTSILEKYDNVKNLAIKLAKEIAIKKQQFSLNSELLNVSMMSADDAREILKETINMDNATVCYLGAPMDEEDIQKIINS